MGDISRVDFYGNLLNLKDTEGRQEAEDALSQTKVSLNESLKVIWGVLNNIQDFVGFVIYSEDDYSLNFYCDVEVPSGNKYGGKTVTAIYTGIESTGTSTNPPWYNNRSYIKLVNIDASFSLCKPTSCYRWFYGFNSCTTFDGLTNLDTSSTTTMYDMFYNCNQTTSLDVSKFNTSNVTTMYDMFYSCSKLTELDVSSFDTGKVTTMYYMFYSCSALEEIYVSNFNTENVTTMYGMFRGCTSVKELDVSNWNTSKVTNLYYTFYNCNKLIELDVSNWDTSKVTDMRYLFSNCSSITTIYSDDNNFVTSAISSSSNGNYVFTSCTNLVGGNGTKFSSSNTNYTYAHVDVDGNPGYFTQK